MELPLPGLSLRLICILFFLNSLFIVCDFFSVMILIFFLELSRFSISRLFMENSPFIVNMNSNYIMPICIFLCSCYLYLFKTFRCSFKNYLNVPILMAPKFLVKIRDIIFAPRLGMYSFILLCGLIFYICIFNSLEIYSGVE